MSHSLHFSEHHEGNETLSELLNEVSLLLGRLSSLDQLNQAQEQEEPAAAGATAVALGPSDRFRLREVCFGVWISCLVMHALFYCST